MSAADRTVCVVGGGITGLVVAHSLATAKDAPKVVLLEASDRLGGVLRTETINGIPVETGADSFVARSSSALDLCRSLGLDEELVAPAVFGAVVWAGGELTRLPRDAVFGMPASARAALTAPGLSRPARVRAALEPLLPGPSLTEDVGVGALVRRRYGRAVLERLVDPLLAGTRAGRAEEISVQAALPSVWAAAHGRRSLTRALHDARSRGGIDPGAPPFRTPAGGLSRLVDALRERTPGAEMRTGARVVAVEGDRARRRVVTRDDWISCSDVVLAIPAPAAAPLVEATSERAAAALRAIEHAPVATVVLVFAPGPAPLPSGTSGLLVPSTEGKVLSACTWYSVKWPQARPVDGSLVIRGFVGRSAAERSLSLDDGALVDAVARDVAEAVGLKGHESALVTRWEPGLPQYRVGHAARVAEIDAHLAGTGLWAAGSSYRGSGIADCIEDARRVAAAVLERLHAVS